jgi:hypothetical protein
MKVSPVLESLAFLARGVESGRPPRGAACPVHVLGPLIGTVIGPAGGRLPWDAVEELFQRASDGRGVTLAEWSDWRRHRFSPFLLQDVTMLAYRGSCVGRSDEVRCRCESAAGDGGAPVFSAHRTHPGLGPVPALTPDPTGRTDPWQDALVELAARFRGRGSPHASKFSGSGPPTVLDIRTLVGNLDRLAGAFAGPRRADRMGGLERLDWNPPLPLTAAWGVRDRAGGTDDGRAELLARLLHAVGA